MRYGMQRSVKLYHSISEVASLVGVEQHILRYWEQEFRQLKPKKNRAGKRIYRDGDIEWVKCIQYLLHEAKYTAEGARLVLNEINTPDLQSLKTSLSEASSQPSTGQLEEKERLLSELQAVYNLLQS